MKTEKLFEKAYSLGKKAANINGKVQLRNYKTSTEINEDWKFLITVPEELEKISSQYDEIIDVREKRELK